MGLDRRTFLQQSGLALFTWGATEVGLSSLVNNNQLPSLINNYQQTLAQPTSRKLALLVGINRYPHNDPLDGCLTDIELQRELLIHRFGFKPQDIVTLSDRQATRENIETTFVEHLSKQAQADDVVVFHFSGYGGQIKMPLPLETKVANSLSSPDTWQLVNSLIPVDGILPSKKASIANSILQETLLMLAQSLSTTKCTFILDTSFNTTPRAKHGNLKIRSANQIAETANPQELVFLEQLRASLTGKGLKPSKRLLSLPGIVFSAVSKNQIAVERHWDGFSTGLFTHALTQHLWQISPSNKVQVVLARTAETVEQVMGRQQQPTLNSPEKLAIAYYLATSDAPNATGIVSQVNNNSLKVKLLGLPANILNCYGVNSCLTLVSDNNDHNLPQLQVKSREGLMIKAQLLPSVAIDPQVGQLVRESIRVFERNLSLTLALDDELQRIERVDATSALANITVVTSTVISGEQNADCLLGKVYHHPEQPTETKNLDSAKQTFSYGLYTPGGMLIGKTVGVADEAVKIAIDRLQPQFNNLLVAKWLELTLNEFSSRLKVNATLVSGTENQASILQRTTFLSENKLLSGKKLAFSKNSISSDPNNSNRVPILVRSSEIKLSLRNTGDRQLYVILFSIDADSNIFTLYTPAKLKTAPAEKQLKNIEIAPQSELVIPSAENSWKWKVSDSLGINTLYAVFSVQPFEQTLKALAKEKNFKLDQQQVLNVVNPIMVVNSLMQDLHSASSVSSKLISSNDDYALDVNSWATLSFVYEVANG